MTRKSKRCRLYLGIAGLLFFFCGCADGTSENPAPPAAQESSAAEPPAPRDGMVQITAGPFLYGSTQEHFEVYLSRSTMNFPGMETVLRRQFVIPPRPEDLPQFHIMEFEVTNREYKLFLDATGYRPEETTNYLQIWRAGTYPDWAADFPVVWISPEEAQQYCRWRGGYLPSEEEWEKAARGAGGRVFPWGNTFPSPEMSNFGRDKAEPVGNRAGDVSPYQVYDLAGNVSEWTSGRARINGEEFLIARGGSFTQPARDTMTTRRRFQRAGTPSEMRTPDIGFRCAAN